RGSHRSIGRPPDRPPLDASRHQTRGGCAAGREAILRFQPVLKGIPRREESGVPRNHLGRALRWISEGREGAPVSNRFDASAGPSNGRTRDAPRTRRKESPVRDLGQRRVRAELPRGAGPRRAGRTRRPSVPGTRREGLEQHLLGRARDRIARRDEGSRRSRAVRRRRGLRAGRGAARGDETARPRKEVDVIGNAYRKATTGIADAEVLYARLQREGFHSYEADVALRDTRRSIREGNYARAIEYLEQALHAFARRTNAREALGRAIEETRKRVQFLRGSGLTVLPDIQEVLTRAEHE